MSKLVISRFTGPYEFLSNFYWFSTGKIDAVTGEEVVTTAEHLFQGMKCVDSQEMDWVGMDARLAETGDVDLVEGNTWGDTFWGVYNGRGENWLGVLLMLTREELRAEVE